MIIITTDKGLEFRYHGEIEILVLGSATWVRATEYQYPGFLREKMHDTWDNFLATEVASIKGENWTEPV